MLPPFAPLLDQHRIFRSRDAEEASAFLQGKEFRLELDPRSARNLDMCINGAYLPGSYLGYIHYGPAVDVRAIHRDDYWIQLPTRGMVEVVGHAESVICDRSLAAVASPVRKNYYLIRSGAGSAGIRLCLFKNTMLGQLAALLGGPVSRALEFVPEMDITTGHGRSLARYIRAAVADLEAPGSMLRNPLAMAAFEQFILTGLLMSQPHNYSDALGRLDSRIAPRDVTRAIDYLEAHLDTPVTIAQLVEAVGVPGRTLFQHFKDFKGVSPMVYLRNSRYERVREALRRAEPDASVTAIAMYWGFNHLGRFATEYRKRFGESPSKTFSRGRLPES